MSSLSPSNFEKRVVAILAHEAVYMAASANLALIWLTPFVSILSDRSDFSDNTPADYDISHVESGGGI
jgi:hypothetical protein